MADTSPNSNKNFVTKDGRVSTFGRSLTQYIQNRLPYSSITNGEDSLNPKYKYFRKTGTRRAEALTKTSISSSNSFNNLPIGDFGKDTSFADIMYASLDENKPGRLRDYRTMASYSEVADALDEICDESINIDAEGQVAKLLFDNIDLTSDERGEIEKEFAKFTDLFDLKQRGWQYFRQLLVEGEVFFELILHEEYTNEGILGAINLPAEVIEPVYNNIQNMLVKGYIYRKPIYSATNPGKVEDQELIPMDVNQVVYISSGTFNETKEFVIPFLENARRPYRQLSLIEDAIIIYRLVRAPERLVFNVDVGNMAPPKAEAYLRKLIQNYWSRKTFDLDQNDVVKKFNPQSMLDAFWFAKRQGSEGTSVDQLQGGANLGELQDLMYFIKKLYRALKVPALRIDPQDQTVDSSVILKEELKFAKFIIRQQHKFAAGLKRGFITHLKFKDMWDKYDLGEMNLEVEFNVPTNYFEIRENQRLELKANNFNNLASSEFISTTYAQKKYLGWKDKDVLANREFLRKDAEMQWELAQIQSAGPNWKEQMIAGTLGAGEEGMESDLGGGGGAAGGIPEFGGGPAAEVDSDIPEADAPEAETAETPPIA
jgi:hypothetical protein